MGGEGSGNWCRFDKKTTTGECHSIGVRYLHREGLLKPGRWFSLRWSRAEWEDAQELVLLDWTACNFGGKRPWFVCPEAGCGRRVAILYGLGRYFLCRHCLDLVYESQRENGMTRALRRAQAIRERLGGSANMTKPFPEKPKGMQWETYDRLWWKHHEAEMEQLAGMREWLDRLEKKVG
jgi:hypothetical protein